MQKIPLFRLFGFVLGLPGIGALHFERGVSPLTTPNRSAQYAKIRVQVFEAAIGSYTDPHQDQLVLERADPTPGAHQHCPDQLAIERSALVMLSAARCCGLQT